jgi:TPR repeat protein
MTNLGYLYFKMATQGLFPFTHQVTKQVMDQDELYFQSATWLRRALFTNENNPDALFLMAKLYEEGYSVDVNPELSQKYYERAGEQGMHKAYTKIAHYQYSRRNVKKAIEMYTLALDKGGDSEAANCLGLIYESQEYKDLDKAKQFYERAIALDGNVDAYFNLGILLSENNQNGLPLI